MQLPKFIRKAILKTVGLEMPITTRSKSPIPREHLIGFTEREIDEIVLGASYKRIEELREVVIDHLTIILPGHERGQSIRKIINNAFEVYTREEAKARSL